MASTEVTTKARGKAAAKTTTTPAPVQAPGFSYITAGLQERVDYIARLAPSMILPTAYRGNAANVFVAAETGAASPSNPYRPSRQSPSSTGGRRSPRPSWPL